MFPALRYLWKITSGYRLRPWRSPYIRWRLETYLGKQGDANDAASFFRLLWRERREMLRFLRWVEEQQREQNSR